MCRLWIVLIALFWLPRVAVAELTTFSSLAFREEYNDNIFLTQNNKDDDFITSIIPALAIKYISDPLNIDLNYTLTYENYARHSSESQITHNANFKSDITVIRDTLFISIADTYSLVPIDQRQPTALDNQLINTTQSNRFIVKPFVQFPRAGSLRFTLGYSYENLWYNDTTADDAENHTFFSSVSHQFGDKASLGLSYSYLLHRPTITPEYDQQTESITFSYQFIRNLLVNGSCGFTQFAYAGSLQYDFSKPVADVQLTYNIGERFTIAGGFSAQYEDSVDQGLYRRKSATASMAYDAKFKTALTYLHNDESYTTSTRKDKSDGVNLRLTVPISNELTLSLFGMYTHYKFLPEDELSNRYGIQSSLEYAMKFIRISCGYTFNYNDSNVIGNDYTNNIVFVQAKANF